MSEKVAFGDVLGVSIAGADLESAVDAVIVAAKNRQPLGVSALAVHGLMEAVKDSDFHYRLNELDLVLPDGQPVRWALRWLSGVQIPDRVPGPDLMFEVCQAAAREGLGIFLFGSTDDTLLRLKSGLRRKVPGLRIDGIQASRFRTTTDKEREADRKIILTSGASIVFVGLGCPRQEIWTYENHHDLSMPVLAVGAAFDYHAGLLKRSPRWMGRAGLEWVYRLMQEPRRLAGRYFRLNPAFMISVVLEKLGIRSFSHDRSRLPRPLNPG